MKELIIKNYKEMQAVENSNNGNTFNVKPVITNENADKCHVDFVEVPPKNFAYGYHYHEVNEEIFYIIEGEAEVRTESGVKHLKQGDMICFPANKSGSHVIFNPSETEKLVYIDFGTTALPDVVHFPDAKAGMTVAKSGIYNFTE